MRRFIVLVLVLMFVGGCAERTVQTSVSVDGIWYNSSDIVKPTPAPIVRTVKISAAGDTTLATDVNFKGGNSFVREVQNQGYDYSYFFQNVADIFADDDLTIVNFEGTLSENGVRKDKTYAFRGDPEYVQILTLGNVDAVNMANNHSYDYGAVSYQDTIGYIEEAGITTFGYDRTAVYEVNGIKVGLGGITALSGTSEASAKQQIESLVAELENSGADIIVLNVHWGIEGDNIPAQKQINIGEYAIDAGVDLVIGHHPHVIQSVQKYKDRYIVYSLGNFCFGGNKNPTDKDCFIWQQEFEVDEDGVCAALEPEIIPCSVSSVTSRNNFQPTPLEGHKRDRLLKRIEEYSKMFK